MFEPKIKVKKELWNKLQNASRILGCSSVEEFVERTLESEVDRIITQNTKGQVSQSDVEEISAKLKGLGYLD